jgi:hypothetical protein
MGDTPTKLFVMHLPDGAILEAPSRQKLMRMYDDYRAACEHDWRRTPSRAIEQCAKCQDLRHTAFVARRRSR